MSALKFMPLVALLISPSIWADQEGIRNYKEALDKVFWGYYVGKKGDESREIYCGIAFKAVPREDGRGFMAKRVMNVEIISIEHAFPAEWIANNLGCTMKREECRTDSDIGERFNHAEGDMHNMWPALQKLNASRGILPFAEIEGEEPREIQIGAKVFKCDFENNGKWVEPRPNVRGNLARSIFYMCSEYGFAVPKGMMPFLRAWNREDPPTPAERRRAELIAEHQGTRNKFIDNPDLGETARCKQGNW